MVSWIVKIFISGFSIFIPTIRLLPSIVFVILKFIWVNSSYCTYFCKLRFFVICISIWSKTHSNTFIILLKFTVQTYLKAYITSILSSFMNSIRAYLQESSITFKVSWIMFIRGVVNCSFEISTSPKLKCKTLTKWIIFFLIRIIKHLKLSIWVFSKCMVLTKNKDQHKHNQ